MCKRIFQVVAVAAMGVWLSGCGVIADKQHRDEVLSYDLAPDVRAAIERKEIKIGMTKDEVKASWGRPCGYCYGTRSTSEGDWWEYNAFGSSRYGAGSGTYLFFGRDDRLKYWSE
ncbi:MAG: hypothetical protein EP334_10220 [Gammaproteobacteria bacterium]|nr:MAG: hypothetical protein EP334_10220 [Gammaproteobacteria bacterium]